ncbi:MAG: hypothetical protein GXP27_14820 [Planctomycetes bacterium]|nr:hypothetical protein [Planctomycetota bacterium]
MFTPFEELEYLAEYLPEEGESVIVTRRHGELVCEPYHQEEKKPVLADPALLGRLIQANERLKAVAAIPLVASLLLAYCGCVAVHYVIGIGWSGWSIDVGVILLVGLACWNWIRARQSRLFRLVIRPMLTWQLRKNHGDAYTLLAEARSRPELRVLVNELWRWIED